MDSYIYHQRRTMKTPAILLFILSCFITLDAQEMESGNIAVLPFNSNRIDLASVQTAESILRMELSKESAMSVISEKKTFAALNGEDCQDEDCAKEIGKKLNAKQVLICALNSLGDKIIVQYTLVETETGKTILSDRATSLSVEDLDVVMKRVAISVARQNPFDVNPEVGNIVQQESNEPLRRTARYNFGFGFGYLFPSDGYDEDTEKSFTLNGYFDYEVMDYAVGLMIGARKGFAANLYGNYLFSKTDICPYLGGALGFHWVAHEDFFSSSKRGDGIELGLESGIRLFHTYNFQMFIKIEYILTFNDYNDRAVVFTIGLL